MTLRRWTYLLGGLLCWAVHFTGLYAFASLEAQTAAPDSAGWRLAAIALSGIGAALCLALAAVALRRLRGRGDAVVELTDQLALLGAVLALVAIAWQSLSVLIA